MNGPQQPECEPYFFFITNYFLNTAIGAVTMGRPALLVYPFPRLTIRPKNCYAGTLVSHRSIEAFDLKEINTLLILL